MRIHPGERCSAEGAHPLAPPPDGTAGCQAGTGSARPQFRAGVGILAMRICGLGCGLLVAVLLGRALGAVGYAAYEVVLAWMALIHVPGGLGADTLVLRAVAGRLARGRRAAAEAVAKVGFRYALLASLTCSAAAIGLAFGAEAVGLRSSVAAFGAWLLWLVPAYGALRVLSAKVQGAGRTVAGSIPEVLLVPSALLASLLVLKMGAGTETLSVHSALAMHGLAITLGAVLAWALARSRNGWPTHVESGSRGPSPMLGAGTKGFVAWGRIAAPLVLVGLLQVAVQRIDLLALDLLVGWSRGAEATGGAWATGVYAAGKRLAALTSLGLVAGNVALAPRVAGLHRRGDVDGMQRAVASTTWFGVLCGFGVAVVLLVAPDWWLGWFGPDFALGTPVVWVLAGGQLCNVLCGPVALLLLMTGHERRVLFAHAVGCLVQLALMVAAHAWLERGNVSLEVPGNGPNHLPEIVVFAAWSSSIGLLVWNVWLVWSARRALGVRADALGCMPAVLTRFGDQRRGRHR